MRTARTEAKPWKIGAGTSWHGPVWGTEGRRCKSCQPDPVMSRDIEDKPNPHLGSVLFVLSVPAPRSRRELAKRMSTTQSVISPLEKAAVRRTGSTHWHVSPKHWASSTSSSQADESRSPSAAAWVAANLAAVTEAIAEAHAGPLTTEGLCGWHRTLMTGSPTPAQHVGVFRSEQGWIGGTSPLDAHLVTPPPGEVPTLVDDLITYVNRDDIDPVSQAAIVHAQFEIIHPFADGNGRVGRVLVAWILVRRLSLVTPPPVSVRIAADVGGYGSGLVLFRMGDHNAWIRWFAKAVSGAGRAQQELVASVERLQRAWNERLGEPRVQSRRVRSDAAAWRVLDLLPRHFVLTGPIVARELAIPLKSASAALDELVAAGVLVEHGTVQPSGRGRPSRLYTSAELLGLTGSNPLRA